MSFDFRIRNGDLAIGQDGDLEKIENTDKLIQDILKIVITPMGSNQFYPWYGSRVSKSLIGNVIDYEFLSTVASSQLQNALENLQRLQQEQARQQRVTPFEQLAAIKHVGIERNQVDPRFFLVIINTVTRALTEANTSLTIKPTL
jgi:phage baseplate assembly protein W